MSVGERLKERREAARLTLGQVGAYEGITPQYLSQLEKEKRATVTAANRQTGSGNHPGAAGYRRTRLRAMRLPDS